MSKQTVPAVHLCRFVGKVSDVKPPKRARCELDQCRSRATAYVVFVWGAAALCDVHTKEETE